MVWLRGTMRSTRPPIVSIPSDSGMTSSNSKSLPVLLPASWLAEIAAPRATTSSGLRLVSGSRPKKLATTLRTCGMRVEPPTRTTPSMSSLASFASRRALRTAVSVRCVRCAAAVSKSSDRISKLTRTLASCTENCTVSALESASLQARAARWSAALSVGLKISTASPALASTQSTSARS